jgi:hypothetical protein
MFTRLKYRILGSTEEVTTCHCCGRENLKKTVALDDYEGNVTYYGETCAAKAMEMKVTEFKKEYTSSVKQLQQEKETFINTHPLMKAIDEEVNEINKQGIPFKQRIELGLTKKWAEMKKQVNAELDQKFSLIS